MKKKYSDFEESLRYRIGNLMKNRLFYKLSDETYLKIKYKVRTGRKLNLDNPIYFSEKIQWLKLYDRNPLYTSLVDKYEVRDYVSKKIGEKYLNPLIGIYNKFEDIDFNSLPNQFVLKCTHDSGGVVICRDKRKLNIERARKKINNSLKNNFYNHTREWPYKFVKPRIICEEYLSEGNDENSLIDYKFFCFNGKVKYCQVIRGRGENETIDFYDLNWNHLPFTGLRSLPNSPNEHSKPLKYDEMIKLARILSNSFTFVRVDFYYVNNNIYFGELTFYPQSGFGSFTPKEWNRKIGDLIEIKDKNV